MSHDPRTWHSTDRPTVRPTDRDDSIFTSLAGAHDTTRHTPNTHQSRLVMTPMSCAPKGRAANAANVSARWIGLDWIGLRLDWIGRHRPRDGRRTREDPRGTGVNTHALARKPKPRERHGRDADASARHRHFLSRESGDGCRRVRAGVRAGRDVGVHRTARAEGCEGGERGDSSGRTSSDDGEHERGVFEFHGARRRRADALDATRRDSTRTRD